jgi:hypothetical protein
VLEPKSWAENQTFLSLCHPRQRKWYMLDVSVSVQPTGNKAGSWPCKCKPYGLSTGITILVFVCLAPIGPLYPAWQAIAATV